jgi:hypothetical protein
MTGHRGPFEMSGLVTAFKPEKGREAL